ncbi:prolipoprotein diacylglyceryl transferase [Candidatus Collierbacteria bacterium]|nr:prolipoprotein diacylglyceryl transferase [Candidatus Collierbacteria bacterium]
MFKIGPLTFNLYGLLIALGMWAALKVSLRTSEKRGVEKRTIESAFWWVIIAGLIGARIYHVVDLWQEVYSKDPAGIFYLWQGGLAIWGGVLGGVLGLTSYYLLKLKKSRIKFLDLLDTTVVGVPLAQAIGRWGNFINRELYGKTTSLPWGMEVEGVGRVHPLFFYESTLNLMLFLVIFKLRQVASSGVISGVYLVGYGVIRTLLENLRPDEIVFKIGNLPVATLVSLVAISTGAVLILRQRRS